MKKIADWAWIGWLGLFLLAGCGGGTQPDVPPAVESRTADGSEIIERDSTVRSDTFLVGEVYGDDIAPICDLRVANTSSEAVTMLRYPGINRSVAEKSGNWPPGDTISFYLPLMVTRAGKNVTSLELVSQEGTAQVPVAFYWRGLNSERPRTRTSKVFPLLMFEKSEGDSFKVKLTVPNLGRVPMRIDQVKMSESGIRRRMSVSAALPILTGLTPLIPPGGIVTISLTLPEEEFEIRKKTGKTFEINVEGNFEMPPVRVRYMELPG